jgi:hypothetical protein
MRRKITNEFILIIGYFNFFCLNLHHYLICVGDGLFIYALIHHDELNFFPIRATIHRHTNRHANHTIHRLRIPNHVPPSFAREPFDAVSKAFEILLIQFLLLRPIHTILHLPKTNLLLQKSLDPPFLFVNKK